MSGPCIFIKNITDVGRIVIVKKSYVILDGTFNNKLSMNQREHEREINWTGGKKGLKKDRRVMAWEG